MSSIFSNLAWTRMHPTYFHPSWFPFVSITKFIEKSINDFCYNHKGQIEVLDFGCGNQPYKTLFKECNYYGCDIGDSPEYNTQYCVIKENEVLPYDDEKFDIILFTEVMEHLKNPQFYSDELVRVLKKWWIIILTVPQVWDYHPYPQHFFMYTPDWINLFFWDKTLSRDYFSDSTPFQTGVLISMMYSNWWAFSRLKTLFILFVNMFLLWGPGIRPYNHASSHIFAIIRK